MLEQKYKIHFRSSLVFLAVLLMITIVVLTGVVFRKSSKPHYALGINEQINYQGRLLTNTGAVVPDGTYNMQFKIYQDGDGALGGGDETLKWTETRESGNKVTVKNGYFSVYLGSVTAFGSSVDWNQSVLWLSINIGGTGTPSYDGEMTPFTRFSSAPYALNTKYLGGLSSGSFVQLAQGTQTDSSSSNASISINKTAGTANLLELLRGGSSVLTVGNNGATTFKNQTNSTSAFQIQNLANEQLFNVDTTNSVVTVNGANSPKLGTWSSTSSLGTARRTPSVAYGKNGYIYAVGGYNAGYLGTSEFAKIKSDGTLTSWTSGTSLNSARQAAATVVSNGYLYVIGGTDGSTLADVEYARINKDGTLGSWSVASSTLNTARERSSATVVDGYIYVVGGTNGANLASVEYAKVNADGTLGTWNTTTSLNTARNSHTVTSVNGYIYAIAGTNGSNLASVEYAKVNADGTLGTWNTTTSLNTARNSHAAASANGYIYAIAGNSGSLLSSVEYAGVNTNGTLGSWTADTNSIGTARDDLKSVSANGYVYAIAGYSGSFSNVVEYSSTSRVRVGGSLDLVGLSAGNLFDGEIGAGGELTAGSTKIIGGLQVQGETSLGEGLSVGGDISLEGSMIAGTGGLTLRSGGISTLTLLGEGGVYVDSSASGQTYIGSQGTLQDVNIGNGGTSSATRIYAGTSGVLVQPGTNTSTAFQIKNTGNVTLFGVDTTDSRIFSGIANGASAVGFALNTSNTFSTAGAKLLSLQNNTSEKFAVDKDGNITVNGNAGLATSCSSSQFLRAQNTVGGITTSGTCASVTGSEITDGSIANADLANSAINLALGTSGTDINWGSSSVSLGGTATLNLPDASTSARGLVTAGTQTFGGNKTFNGDLEVFGSNINLGNNIADSISFQGEVIGASPLAFEGATNDNIRTIFAITDPTSTSKTITFPNATGYVILDTQFSGDATVSSSGLVTISGDAIGAAEVANGTLTTLDLSSSAGITNSQLANSSISFALGTSGSDANWSVSPVSLGGTATLNLPDAGSSARGVVSTGSQTFAGAKTFSSLASMSAGINVIGDADVSHRVYVPGLSGTNGQGFFTGTSSTTLGGLQSLDLGGNTYTFFGNNKYYNGSAWVDSGLSRTGASFQLQNDSFTFYSFDTGTTFTPRFTVASGGNVGIGLSGAPAELLSVGGTTGNFLVNTSGNLMMNFNSVPTIDLASISNSGQGTTTNGVDGLSIDFTQSAVAGNRTNSIINLTGTSGATESGDTLYGININDIAGQTGNETAINIGLGWDIGMNVKSGGIVLDKNSMRFIQEASPGAPTVAINATAGNLNGTYTYCVTFVTPQGETNCGTVSSSVAPASQQVNLTAIPTGTANVITARKIYRAKAFPGGTTYQNYMLVTTINDNTTTTYTDNIADNTLGALAPFASSLSAVGVTSGGASDLVLSGGPWVDARAYGAKCDNVTDDTTAIQNAINAASRIGGTVRLPTGQCIINSTLNINDSTVKLVGQGAYANDDISALSSKGTAIIAGASWTATNPLVKVTPPTAGATKPSIKRIAVQDLTFECAGRADYGLQLISTQYSSFRDLFFRNCNRVNLDLDTFAGTLGEATDTTRNEFSNINIRTIDSSLVNTTINGAGSLPTGTITVVSTTGFNAGANTLAIFVGQSTPQYVTCTGTTATTFTGCTGGTGTLAVGQRVAVYGPGSASGIRLNGSASASPAGNTSVNNFSNIQILYGHGTAIMFDNSDSNRFYGVSLNRGNNTGIGVEFGAGTSAADSSRANVFYAFDQGPPGSSSAPQVIARGTQSSTVAAQNNQFFGFSRENGTTLPTIENGAILYNLTDRDYESRVYSNNFGSLMAGGAFISNTSMHGQEWNAPKQTTAITADSVAIGDDTNWYFDTTSITSTYQTPADVVNGYARLTFGTTSGVGGLIGYGEVQNDLQRLILKANLPVLQMKVRTNINNTTNDIFWGMSDQATAPTANDTKPANGIYFWNNNAAGAWQGVVRSGAADVGTVTCPGAVSTTQFAVGRIQVESATSVRFLIDNDSSDGVNLLDCGVVSGANPTAAMGMMVYNTHTETTGSRSIDVDYIRLWQDDAPPVLGSDGEDSSGNTDGGVSLLNEEPSLINNSDSSNIGQIGMIDFLTATEEDQVFENDVYIKGTLHVDKIKANQIEGLEVLTDKLSALSDTNSTTSSTKNASDEQDNNNPVNSGVSTNNPTNNIDLNNLVVQKATISLDLGVGGGLSVGGPAEFRGNAVFYRLVTFVEKTVFKNDISFEGRVQFNNDTAGYAVINPGQNQVRVTFSQPNVIPPVVTVSVKNGQFAQYSYKDLSPQGFTIVTQQPVTEPIEFSWIALDVASPKTSQTQ